MRETSLKAKAEKKRVFIKGGITGIYPKERAGRGWGGTERMNIKDDIKDETQNETAREDNRAFQEFSPQPQLAVSFTQRREPVKAGLEIKKSICLQTPLVKIYLYKLPPLLVFMQSSLTAEMSFIFSVSMVSSPLQDISQNSKELKTRMTQFSLNRSNPASSTCNATRRCSVLSGCFQAQPDHVSNLLNIVYLAVRT